MLVYFLQPTMSIAPLRAALLIHPRVRGSSPGVSCKVQNGLSEAN